MLKKDIKYYILPILIAITGFLFPLTAWASFTFSTAQNVLSIDNEITLQVNLSLQGQTNKNYYLESAFKKESETNYFGLTWNELDWLPYTASTNYQTLQKITTDSKGNWI